MERQVTVQFDDGMRQLCRAPLDLALHVDDLCITEFKGVRDYGRIVELQEDPRQDTGKDAVPTVIRRATLQDQAKSAENVVHSRMAAATCRQRIEETQCEMHLLNARYNFDRSLLIVSFSAEDRVDFRELIKILANELSARVEMRQVGVRDAARRIGGMGSCGRNLCCRQWLRKFEAVNVKMAKQQGVSLSASCISGMCGRLKCCLRYESDAYRALARALPDVGAPVETPEGDGVIIDRNLIKGKLTVRLDDHRIHRFEAGDLRVRAGAHRKQGRRKSHENPDTERAES